jgi:ribosome-binding factor A
MVMETLVMPSRRMQRISELVKRQVGATVQRMTLRDCGFVTITAAEISPDLKEGRIFVSVIGTDEQKQRALRALESQRGLIQGEISRNIVMKYTPHLQFVLDETEAHAERIERLLDELDTDTHP